MTAAARGNALGKAKQRGAGAMEEAGFHACPMKCLGCCCKWHRMFRDSLEKIHSGERLAPTFHWLQSLQMQEQAT